MEEVKSVKKSIEIFSSFYIDSTEVALNVRSIQEVVNFPEKIIPMPMAPDFLLGVFNLRGLIIPVINLKRLLHFENASVDTSQKVAILEYEGARIGLVFDRTSEILRVTEDQLCECNYLDERSHKVVTAAIKLDHGARILQVIDPFSLFTIENIPQILDQQKRLPSHAKQKIQMQDRKKCISFCVSGMKMAFEISGIHEIVHMMEFQHSSVQQESCMGLINLREMVIPIVCFSKLLKIPPKDNVTREDQRIIILKFDQVLFGLIVDSVESINYFSVNELMPVPLFSSTRSEMFAGCIVLPDIGEVFLLNHQGVFSTKEVSELTQGHSKVYGINSADTIKKAKMSRKAYISFRLKHLFGVSMTEIKEIINYTDDVLEAPGLPHFVRGMLNLRGRLVTIIDTKLLYKMESPLEVTPETKILIFEKDSEMFGLVVDSVDSIVTVDSDKNLKVPEIMIQQVKDQFGNDIKEVVSVKNQNEKETALIILNVEPITLRIQNLVAA